MNAEDIVDNKFYYAILKDKAIARITKYELYSEMCKNNYDLEFVFESLEEAKECLLEKLELKLHQALDDKEAILYNIKELKKNIKNANNKVIFKEIK